MPVAQLTQLAAAYMGVKNKTPEDWLPAFAQTVTGAPAWVRQDLRAAVEAGFAPPELVDAVASL